MPECVHIDLIPSFSALKEWSDSTGATLGDRYYFDVCMGDLLCFNQIYVVDIHFVDDAHKMLFLLKFPPSIVVNSKNPCNRLTLLQ